MNISVLVADGSHVKYAQEICDEIALSAKERGTGIAQRIIPFEAEVVRRGNEAIKKIRRGINGKGILNDYYTWVDQYVKENYPSEIEAFEIANR